MKEDGEDNGGDKGDVLRNHDWISVNIPAMVYPQMFVLMMLAYVVVGVMQFLKIQKIPMEDALKNVE